MKKLSYNKLIFVCFALAMLCIVLFFIITNVSSLSQEPEIGILPDNNYDQTITVVSDVMFDPFSFLNKNGEPSGYDVELLYAIANKMQVNVELKLMDWGDCKKAIANGEAHFITGNPYSQDGYENLIQSGVLTDDPFVSIGRENFKSVRHLYDKKLATIEKSGAIIDFLEPYKLVKNTKYYTSYTDAVMSVVSGENDYAIVRFSVGNRILAKLESDEIRIVGPVLASSLLCIGVNENYPDLANRLDSAIKELQDDGTMNSLTEKWLGHYVELIGFGDLARIYRSQIFITIILIIIFISAFAFYIYRKRMEIRHAEQENKLRQDKLAAVLEANRIIENREKMLRALYEMAFILLSHSDTVFENILSASLKPVANAANIDIITIYKYVYTDKEKYIEHSYRWEKKKEEFVPIDENMKILPDTPVTRKWISSLEKGMDINIHAGIMSEEEKAFLDIFGVKSILMIPVFIKDEIWGAINFQDHIDERLFDEVSIDMMHSAAHLLTDAILREQLYLDALTGIKNRRYFDEKANILFKNLTRSNGMLSIVMIDIDFFKKYNDTYGHREGDKCLKIIAQTISKSVIRESDFAARYGGEEFVVVLPNTDDDGAHKVAKRLIENIHDSNIPHEKSEIAAFVTISIGVAVGKVNCTQSLDDYIKRADELLYISKKDGRNRYTMGMV
jgi:diguanylate cyclase (GGDEF)-like protein